MLSDPAYILGSGSDTSVLLGALFELITALAGIGTAVALYPVIRRQSEALRIGFVATRIFEGAVIFIGVVSLMSLVSLRQAGAAAGTDASALVAGPGARRGPGRDVPGRTGPHAGPERPAAGLPAVPVAPRAAAIPALGLIGAPLFLASAVATIFGVNEQVSALSRHRGHPDLHLGAVARPLADLQGLQAVGRGRAAADSSDARASAAATPVADRRRDDGGCSMTADRERTATIPPRLVVRTAWVLHRALYRFSGGRIGLRPPEPGAKFGMMRLTTVGRRSGQPRVAIVGYYEDGPNLVTLAMNGWADAEPAWWLNLQAQPDTIVELKDGPRAVRGRAAEGEERDRLWARWGEFSDELRRLGGHAFRGDRGRRARASRRGLTERAPETDRPASALEIRPRPAQGAGGSRAALKTRSRCVAS